MNGFQTGWKEMHIFYLALIINTREKKYGSENNSEKAVFLCVIWRRWKVS